MTYQMKTRKSKKFPCVPYIAGDQRLTMPEISKGQDWVHPGPRKMTEYIHEVLFSVLDLAKNADDREDREACIHVAKLFLNSCVIK